MSWLSQGLDNIGNIFTGNHDTPNPQQFNQNGFSTSSSMTPPPAGLPPGFNQQKFLSDLQTNKDLSGIWQTIQDKGGDIWGVLTKFLPKNADGSTDWGKVGGDLLGFVKNNAQTIIDGIGAVSNYNRQQQSDKYAQQGLDLAKENWKDNEGLRLAGRAGMLNPTANAPDLSKLKTLATTGSGNPFAGGAIPLDGPARQGPIDAPAAPPRIPQAPPQHSIPLIPQGAPSPAPTAEPTPRATIALDDPQAPPATGQPPAPALDPMTGKPKLKTAPLIPLH